LGSLLHGKWTGAYRQTNQFGGGVIANVYEDNRVTPVAEFEVGLGWQSKTGGLRLTTGYLSSAWIDALSTRTYVDAVRSARGRWKSSSSLHGRRRTHREKQPVGLVAVNVVGTKVDWS